MCEIYGFCGLNPVTLNKYTNEFWKHSSVHRDGYGYFLADKNDLYVNTDPAFEHKDQLEKKNFKSSRALCHIRFKTHGPTAIENCHPFIKYDIHGTQWSLIHNGYIEDHPVVDALGTIQLGETDSERILLCIVETVNRVYEHSWITSKSDMQKMIFNVIENILAKLSSLGKVNVIFCDNKINNMYVYMNHPGTLWYLNTDNGIHFSTTKLTDEKWLPVEPYHLHVYNSGRKIR